MSRSTGVASGALSEAQLHQLKWLLGGGLALLAMWGMGTVPFSSAWLVWPLGGALLLGLLWPSLPGALPRWFWTASTPVLVTFIVLDFALHLRGGQVIEPILRMTLLLTFLRAVQYRRNREDLQLALLCLFTLVVTGVLTTSILFAVQMLLFVPLAMIFLFLGNMLTPSRERMLESSDWHGFAWPAFCKQVGRSMDLGFAGLAGLLFVLLTVVSSLIFILFPRINVEQSFGLMALNATGGIGFNDSVRFGDVSSLQDDQSVALRIQPPRPEAVPEQLYWRMVVLDRYRSGEFIASSYHDVLSGVRDESRGFRLEHQQKQAETEPWRVYMEGGVSPYLPFLGRFSSITFSEKVSFRGDRERVVIKLDNAPVDVFGFLIEGMDTAGVMPTSMREQNLLAQAQPIPEPQASRGEDARVVNYPLTTMIVPAQGPELDYLQRLARNITGGRPLSPEAKVQAISQWLQQRFTYSWEDLTDYSEARYPLVTWLREGDRGWCEHFAGAQALLLRVAGVPSRMVVGFSGGAWNDYEGYLVVRNNNAHAWVEYFDGQSWRRTDATPAAGGPAGLGAMAATQGRVASYGGFQAWLDTLRMAWYRTVVDFDHRDQEAIAEDLRAASESYAQHIQNKLRQFASDLRDWLATGWDGAKVTLLLSLLGFALVFWYVQKRLRTWWAQLRWRSHNRAQVVRVRRRAGRLLRRFLPAFHLWANAAETAARRQQWRQSLGQLQALRYGDLHHIDDPELILRQARRLLARPRR